MDGRCNAEIERLFDAMISGTYSVLVEIRPLNKTGKKTGQPGRAVVYRVAVKDGQRDGRPARVEDE